MPSQANKIAAVLSTLDENRAKSYKQELLKALNTNSLQDEICTLLDEIPPNAIAAWISKEQISTAAAVICLAQPQTAGNIFKLIPKERQVELCLSINGHIGIEDVAINLILGELKNLKEKGVCGSHLVGGIDSLAKLIEAVPASYREKLLQDLSEKDKNLAASLAKKMLSLEKISSLSTKDLARVCRDLSDRDLVLALKLEKITVCEKFFAAVSKARSQALQDLMQSIGQVRRSDAETAQQLIQETATKLYQAGNIAFPWDDTYV